MPLNIGKILIDSNIQSELSSAVALPTSVGAAVEIIEFETATGSHLLFVSAKAPSLGYSKQFGISLNINQTNNVWYRVDPLEEPSSITQDFDLDVKSNGVKVILRIRRTLGVNPAQLNIVFQNLGDEITDATLLSGPAVYPVTIPTSSVSSIPFGFSASDHNSLSNIGFYNHIQIDNHINSADPHSGHEKLSNKGQANGYAGLNSLGKISASNLNIGTGAGSIAAGDDPRFAQIGIVAPHSSTHRIGGSDVLSLGDLAGSLSQAKSHDFADTDSGTQSLHHTLGTGANQAAAGNHGHTGYATSDAGVTGGNNHNHSSGDGAPIAHSNLTGIGTATHTDIDAHIESASPHIGHEIISNKNQPSGYAGLNVDGKIDSELIQFGNISGTVCEGNDPRLTGPRYPLAHAGMHRIGGEDPLVLTDFAGELPQERTHEQADTDLSGASLHHTLGTGANQAAPGNHTHSEYATSVDVVTGGNAHDHSSGNGAPISHLNLTDKGAYNHAQLDSHIDNEAPHSGHEVLSDKGQPSGYAGLDAMGKVPVANLPVGSGASEVCSAIDARLSDPREPTSHASSHFGIGADALNLGDLGGNLSQLRSHEEVDTDESAEAIHHTLGTGANQAAAGNHSHPELSGSFAPVENGVTGGNTHDHSSGNGGQISHLSLSDTGSLTHIQLDAHVSSAAPHSGHETLDSKNQPYGYPGLDSEGKILTEQLRLGYSTGEVCAGDDPRLSNSRVPSMHAQSHAQGGTDELGLTDLAGTLADISGNLEQSRSHDNVDTDAAANAIHHTLGTGETQAAPGNHTHDDLALVYAPITNGVTGGDTHSHTAGAGGQISHTNLSDTGLNTHDQIDSHIVAQAPHAGHEVVSAKGQINGYASLDENSQLYPYQIPFGSLSATVCEGNDPRLSNARTPVAHAASHKALGSDPILIGELDGMLSDAAGSLEQIRTHDNADTNAGIDAIHHTLGTGSTQAAPGDHLHDDRYLPQVGGMLTGPLYLASDPVSPMEPVTKQMLETAIDGMSLKKEVRVATSSNILLEGLQVIDDVQLIEYDRVGVISQDNPVENGIYIASAGAWVRSTDFDGTPVGEVRTGAYFYVCEGTLLGKTKWAVGTTGDIDIGVSIVEFYQYAGAGSFVPGAGLTSTGMVFNVGSSNSIAVGADDISVKLDGATLVITTNGLKVNDGLFAPASHTHAGSDITSAVPTATSATKLATARTINGVSFDGTANITVTAAPSAHTHTGSEITSAAPSATKLATARTINGVSFDGTADITISDSTKAPIASPGFTGTPTAPTAAVGTNTTQLATTAFVNAEIANDAPSKTGTGASGTWGINVSGNAATATKLATARTINGVSFDGTANININAPAAPHTHAGADITSEVATANVANRLRVSNPAPQDGDIWLDADRPQPLILVSANGKTFVYGKANGDKLLNVNMLASPFSNITYIGIYQKADKSIVSAHYDRFVTVNKYLSSSVFTLVPSNISNADMSTGQAFDGTEFYYVFDNVNFSVRKYSTITGNLITSWGSRGSGQGQFESGTTRPNASIAIGPDGNVYVHDAFLGRIQKFSSSGSYLGVFSVGVPVTDTSVYGYRAITIDSAGTIYLPPNNSDMYMRTYSLSGTLLTETAAPTNTALYGSNSAIFISAYGHLIWNTNHTAWGNVFTIFKNGTYTLLDTGAVAGAFIWATPYSIKYKEGSGNYMVEWYNSSVLNR